ncbi:MAG: Ltp family lipoprotein, partial [Ilumatobacteraceae bacterium]
QNADWNYQASRVAQSYLDFAEFTRQELINQLLFDDFSQSEAEYGVNAVGL